MNNFTTIKDNVQVVLVEKKSKFIANLFYVESIEEVEDIISKIKKKYYDARHNCIAYRLIKEDKIIEKSSDDGEPSGTAGQPMLNILQKNNLANVLIIVTRYFGGILLGTGGLVRAYSNSLQKAIENSKMIEKCIGYNIEVGLEYNEFEFFKYYCKNKKISIVDVNYVENIFCTIEADEIAKCQLLRDFETKKIKLNTVNVSLKKYIEKNI